MPHCLDKRNNALSQRNLLCIMNSDATKNVDNSFQSEKDKSR